MHRLPFPTEVHEQAKKVLISFSVALELSQLFTVSAISLFSRNTQVEFWISNEVLRHKSETSLHVMVFSEMLNIQTERRV